MLRETRERIVARVKIVRKSLALERASGFAFSYHKTKKLNNHHAVMVVIKVIKVIKLFPTSFSPSSCRLASARFPDETGYHEYHSSYASNP
jgi:hypothetical protein